MTSQTDAEGGVTVFIYDLRGNLTTLTDAEGKTTTFEYDLAGRKIKEIRPMGQETVFSYYPNGLLKTVQDAKQQLTNYTYDKANRLIEVTCADDTHDNFNYDAVGNLTGYSNPEVSGTITYDALNRKLSETVDYGPFQKTFSYTYESRGNKQTYTSPEGLVHNYTYRKNDQLKAISVDGKTFTFDFDKNRLSKLTFPNDVVTDYTYNANAWLTGITTTGPTGTILNSNYTHDQVGNIQTKNTEHGLYEYGYDRTYQLTSADNPTLQDEAYSYDKVGNRLTSLAAAGLWSYNINNELIADTLATYEYDANGNTIKKTEGGQITFYEYNARNRLRKVYLPDGRVAIYTYDPFGKRIRKLVANTVTYFAYADEGLIGAYSELGVLQKAYGWSPGGLWGTDPLYQTDSGHFYCYHNDHLGTPQSLTDATGAVVWSAHYQSFGSAIVDPALTVANNLRLSGQYYDAETGLHYNWHRTYNPVIGKYTQVDPIGFSAGDVNLYRYVQNDPINYFDSTGLFLDSKLYEALLAEAAEVTSAAKKGSRFGPLVAAAAVAGKILAPKSVGDATLDGNQCEENPCWELYLAINDHINRNKRLYGDGTKGTHGLRFRFGEQISGAHGPGTEEWDHHHEQIIATQKSLSRLLKRWKELGCDKDHDLPHGTYTWLNRNPPTPDQWRGPNYP